MKTRLFTAVCAGMLIMCSLTGCASDSTEKETQMPYGSTVTIDPSRSMSISYDSRFLDDALIEKIYTYYHSIETKDGEMFNSVLFPLYHEYQMKDIYEEQVTDQTLVEDTYDAIKDYFDYDFAYSFIDVTNLKSSLGESSSRDALVVMLDELASEKEMASISEDTQKLYELTVTRYVAKQGEVTKRETDNSLEGETLYAIQYQDQWYLMYS